MYAEGAEQGCALRPHCWPRSAFYLAWGPLRNIWGYNDSGTLFYILVSLVPGLPGLALLAYAATGFRGRG